MAQSPESNQIASDPTILTPTEQDLSSALTTLRSKNPSLGIPKLHVLLLTSHPEWTVSEKRTRKVLQALGLVLTSEKSLLYPSSKVISRLDISRWTNKLSVHFFNKKKGKGLIVNEKLIEGEVIWKEDPFAIAPEWYVYPCSTDDVSVGTEFWRTYFVGTYMIWWIRLWRVRFAQRL
jgi:hypothetical protein